MATDLSRGSVRARRLLLSWIVYSVVLVILFTRPRLGRDLAQMYFEGVDILGHLVLFGPWGFGLAFLLRMPVLRGRAILEVLALVALAGAVFGLFTELLQNAVAGRSGDVFDFLADAFGAAVGALACLIFPRSIYGRWAGIRASRPVDSGVE